MNSTMKKPVMLALFAVSLYLVLSKFYKQGGQGLPVPTVITGPVYLYALLLLAADFIPGGVAVALAAGSTLLLYYNRNPKKKPLTKKQKADVKTSEKRVGSKVG